MQVGGVQATTKHFVGNEQEYLRIVSDSWYEVRDIHLHRDLRVAPPAATQVVI